MSRLAWGIGALLAADLLLITVASTRLAVIDLNDFKPEAVKAVWDTTGRTITLNGSSA